MVRKTIVSGWFALVVGVAASSSFAAPWWEDFPRMVDTASPSVVSDHHGSFAMNANGTDPAWGTFFQASGLSGKVSSIAAFQSAGLKQIYYSETYGQSYCLVSELGAWDETNLTPILHHHWNWQLYGGGAIRWLGAKNFFDDEDFARPYTRTHSRYGGVPMTYPDGTEASGYDGTDTDPRNSRVYDAACSKDLLGELSIEYYTPPAGSPTSGLVQIPGTSDYAGLLMLKKDATCPLWTNYTYASTLQAADAGVDGMWTDNYGPWDSFGNPPVKHAFGDWSVARFRDHLNATYNSFSFAIRFPAAINNGLSLATLDIREYLKERASDWASWGSNLGHPVWSDSDWLDDPMWREYMVFKRETGTEALSNYYSSVKAAALAGGKTEFLVTGNDIPGFSLGWCRGDLDMVSTEMGMGWQLSNGSTGFTPPPTGRYGPFYKLAREHAKSRFVNVWLYDDHYVDELTHPELLKVLYYEMLSTHTLPRFQPTNPRIAGDETTNAGFFEFVEQAEPMYGNRVPVEDIGIYYSSSSILRHFTPGGYEDHDAQPHQFGFWGWGTALGELHYQYRAVPEWKLTSEMLDTLRVLVIPNADVLDPADVTNVLTPWVNAGGRLIITGDSGKYRGESGNFDLNSGGWSIASLTNHANVVYLSNNVGMDYYQDYNRPAAKLSPMETAMNTALAGAGPGGVTTEYVTSTTGITLYGDEDTERFFVDVNNFNIDNSTYVVTETGAMFIEALLPVGMRGKTLYASVMSPQATTPAVVLVEPSDSNHVKFWLDSVEYYAGVVISTANCTWADPAASGSWNTASNWMPADVPDSGDVALWRYDPNNPAITIAAPAEAASFTAYRSDGSSSYWNYLEGLKILNHGANTGSLTIGGGSGLLDMWDGGWFGSRLTVVNESEAAAADIVNAGEIKVRDFLLDTKDIPSGTSYFTHEEGTLEVMVQIELGGTLESGDEAVFRQSGGTVTVNHDTLGLQIGYGTATKGAFILDGGTSSISTITFAHTDSVFDFNNGVFQSGARDVVWKSWDGITPAGALQLAETGTHTFDVASGRTMTINAEVQLADKPGEKGTLVKTGAGTLALDTESSNSGTMDIQQGVLALSTTGLDSELQLLVDSSASVVLGYAGTNTISALSFDGGGTWAASGVWGATGSGAEYESSLLSGTGRVRVLGLVPPASWLETYFTEAEIAAGLAMGDQDPDGDGMDNLFEYAIGGNPRIDDAASVRPVAEFTVDWLTYVYNRRIDAASLGLEYGLAYDLDLVDTNDWFYVGGAWEVGTNTISAEFEAITNEVDISEVDQGFIRLEIRAD